MPKFIYKACLLALILFSLNPFFVPQKTEASISACDVSVDPDQIQTSSEESFFFTIRNFDVNPIFWIKITRPSTNFIIVEPVSTGSWSASTTSSAVTLTGDAIQPNFSADFEIKVATNDQTSSSADWIIQVSDDLDGAEPFTCTGDLGTEITCANPDCAPPVISNISLSNLTQTSVKISWQTDEASTSLVRYGLTSSYGSSKSNSSLVLSHSLTLTGLSPDTGYHFSIRSVDGSGNSADTSDSTFLTPQASSSGESPQSGGEDNNSLGNKKNDLVKKEAVPPTVSIQTDFSKPFKKEPEISGVATDNAGVFLVEYSTDGGNNWLPADKMVGRESKKVTFSFTPINLEEGNYDILVQATDTSGNSTLSERKVLVLDRLDPIVGGSVISIGPQILLPDQNGLIHSIVGVDQKITLSAVGGPTEITISTQKSEEEKTNQLFSLTRSTETGLWNGVLSFSSPGVYKLFVEAIDGAKNRTEREIGQVYATLGGRVEEKKEDNATAATAKAIVAEVSIYYFEEDSKSWVVWDGESYSQTNPQKTDQEGRFQFFLPAGKYYLKTQASGFETTISNIFSLDKPTPITQSISLKKSTRIGFGGFSFVLPSFSIQKIQINTQPAEVTISSAAQNLVGKGLPSLSLDNVVAEKANLLANLGKPTLISFVSTWAPSSQEQFGALESLEANPDINLVPIAEGQNLSKLKAFKSISASKLTFFADPDGLTVDKFSFQNLPTHYFVDRKGIIKKVVVGVLSKEEIIENLGN